MGELLEKVSVKASKGFNIEDVSVEDIFRAGVLQFEGIFVIGKIPPLLGVRVGGECRVKHDFVEIWLLRPPETCSTCFCLTVML